MKTVNEARRKQTQPRDKLMSQNQLQRLKSNEKPEQHYKKRDKDYKANIDLPGADLNKPTWHVGKQDMMENYYTAIGKTPKEAMKDTDPHVKHFLSGLKKYIKDMRLVPFTSGTRKGERNSKAVEPQIADGKKNKPTAEEKLLYAKARRNDWCKEYLHTGSVYEGLKATAELEYDVMFIMKGEKFFYQKYGGKDFPCHFKLVQNAKKRQRSLLNNLLITNQVKEGGGRKVEGGGQVKEELILSPAKVMQRFESVVHRYTNWLKERKKKTKRKEGEEWILKVDDYIVRRHGPAIQVDMMRKGKIGEAKEVLWYQVDLVPCYEIGKKDNARLFVAKPPKISPEIKVTADQKFVLGNSWRMSFSREEKEKLSKLDIDQGCRRQVVRFLKGMTQSDPTLKGMTSYYWKNVLFHLTDDEARIWEKESFTERVFDMIWYMSRFVHFGKLPLYFSPKTNLFQNMDAKTRERIHKRLFSLYSNEKKFERVFQSVSKEAEKESAIKEFKMSKDDFLMKAILELILKSNNKMNEEFLRLAKEDQALPESLIQTNQTNPNNDDDEDYGQDDQKDDDDDDDDDYGQDGDEEQDDDIDYGDGYGHLGEKEQDDDSDDGDDYGHLGEKEQDDDSCDGDDYGQDGEKEQDDDSDYGDGYGHLGEKEQDDDSDDGDDYGHLGEKEQDDDSCDGDDYGQDGEKEQDDDSDYGGDYGHLGEKEQDDDSEDGDDYGHLGEKEQDDDSCDGDDYGQDGEKEQDDDSDDGDDDETYESEFRYGGFHGVSGCDYDDDGGD